MVLEKCGEILINLVALLRIRGTKVANVPITSTLLAYQKQGMMCRLVCGVEQVLASA
jgi:hypothetical protein